MHLRLRNKRGDTIVEVLIAVAIISLVLVTSYASTNNSTKATIDAQEHSQAMRAVETQLEFLHSKGKTAGNNVCFDSTGAEQSSGSAACTVTPYGAGTQPAYILSITCSVPNGVPPVCTWGSGNFFTVTATWPSVFGNGNSLVSMYYRPPPS